MLALASNLCSIESKLARSQEQLAAEPVFCQESSRRDTAAVHILIIREKRGRKKNVYRGRAIATKGRITLERFGNSDAAFWEFLPRHYDAIVAEERDIVSIAFFSTTLQREMHTRICIGWWPIVSECLRDFFFYLCLSGRKCMVFLWESSIFMRIVDGVYFHFNENRSYRCDNNQRKWILFKVKSKSNPGSKSIKAVNAL